MAIAVLHKQLLESELFDFDFSSRLAATETVASVTTLTVAPTTSPALGVTEVSLWVSGKGVQFRLAAGIEGAYDIVCTILTSLGNTLVGDGRLNVFDDQ